MLVLVHVSSMNTRCLGQAGAGRASSGRGAGQRPAAAVRLPGRSYFVTQPQTMDEFPHRPVVDLEPALGQLGDRAAQGEPSRVNPMQKPQPVLTDDFGRPIAAHLARRRTAGRPQPLRPPHDACRT
jgi:hypothetical protein